MELKKTGAVKPIKFVSRPTVASLLKESWRWK